MAKFRLPQKVLPEVTLLEFLTATGLSLAQMSDYYGWPYDTLKTWSAKQGPPGSYHRQLLASRLKDDLAEIKALLAELKR